MKSMSRKLFFVAASVPIVLVLGNVLVRLPGRNWTPQAERVCRDASAALRSDLTFVQPDPEFGVEAAGHADRAEHTGSATVLRQRFADRYRSVHEALRALALPRQRADDVTAFLTLYGEVVNAYEAIAVKDALDSSDTLAVSRARQDAIAAIDRLGIDSCLEVLP